MKQSNKLNIVKIRNKFYFRKSYYNFRFEGEILSSIITEKTYKEGTLLTKLSQDEEVITVHYKGDLTVSEGDKIKEGSQVASSGRIRKTLLTSPVTGKVTKIDEAKKTIEITYLKIDKEAEEKFKPTKMPFSGKIHKIFKNHLILEFNAFTINLFALKGSEAIGNLKHIKREDLFSEESTDIDVNNCIVFVDTLDTEFAAKLSVLGVKGILVNELSYLEFSKIMTLAMPIGIISGYGHVDFDKKLKTYLQSLENTKVLIDSEYNKVHFLTSLKPEL